ncbi:MAG: hypothetical protein AABW88_02480 [Nanoarchaeota archaeon]
MKNKGQVEVQFNWIFILIVGAIILSFFVVIAMRQKQASESSINVGFFVNFEKALSGISVVEGKKLLFEVPNMDLNYECTQSCDCAAYAGVSRARASASFNMRDKLIFSPNKLKGNHLLTMSTAWSYPFRIVNFLYITSPEVKYLIEDTPLGNSFYNLLPDKVLRVEQTEQRAFDKQLFTPDQPIKAISGNYKAKFTFIESKPEDFTIPSELVNLPNKDVTAIYFEKTAGSPERIRFYEKDSSDKTKFRETGVSYSFGEATQIGAIFAEDLNAYACMMNKALKKYEMVARVYLEKQNALVVKINEILLTNPSSPLKNCLISYVNSYMDEVIINVPNINFKNQLGENDIAARDLTSNVRSISLQNDNAIRGSCPQIY